VIKLERFHCSGCDQEIYYDPRVSVQHVCPNLSVAQHVKYAEVSGINQPQKESNEQQDS